MTTPSNKSASIELRVILAKLKAKTTLNRYIREHNDEYWADIYEAEQQLNDYFRGLLNEVIGEDDKWAIYDEAVNMNDETNQHIKVRNNLRAAQRAKFEDIERKLG